jgi:hypothetical protein
MFLTDFKSCDSLRLQIVNKPSLQRSRWGPNPFPVGLSIYITIAATNFIMTTFILPTPIETLLDTPNLLGRPTVINITIINTSSYHHSMRTHTNFYNGSLYKYSSLLVVICIRIEDVKGCYCHLV